MIAPVLLAATTCPGEITWPFVGLMLVGSLPILGILWMFGRMWS